jgi:hypothetical protein
VKHLQVENPRLFDSSGDALDMVTPKNSILHKNVIRTRALFEVLIEGGGQSRSSIRKTFHSVEMIAEDLHELAIVFDNRINKGSPKLEEENNFRSWVLLQRKVSMIV